jgi:hypothetical protein
MYVLLYCGVCTGVRLLPPGENPIAVRNNNNNNNKHCDVEENVRQKKHEEDGENCTINLLQSFYSFKRAISVTTSKR